MEILNRPECVKCGEPALTLISGLWLCGECFHKHLMKVQAKNKKILLEE